MRVAGGRTTVPDRPTGFTPRPHLLARLDRAAPGQLVLVVAPPGHGKTALLADWLRRPGGPPSAWVSLDAADDAPHVRSALLAALSAIPDLPADSPVRTIARTGERAGPDVVDDLAAALDAARPPIRLVLDDLQELTSAEALRDIARLVRRRPAGLRLVLASRLDPPLPLARMRLEGRLHELRAEDLRLGVAETAALLAAAGLALTDEQVAVLHARTDGWVAGLRLAALALRGRADVAGFVTHFSGSERSVADYLTEEVMAGLPADTRRFLHVAAVCSVLPVELAVALSERPDAERVLDELDRRTGLVDTVQPGTYRIPTLLRSYLVTDLERHDPALHRRSHAAAARWWLAADPVHALPHGKRASDPELLLGLLRECGVRLIATGRLREVRRALDAAGATAVAADPWAALLAALAHHEGHALPEAAAALAQARRIPRTDAEPALDVLRASADLLVRGDPPATRPTGPSGAVPVELDVLLQLSRAAAAAWAGEPDGDDFRPRLDGVVALSREHDLPYFEVRALSLLAAVEAHRGRYRAMAEAAQAAVTAAARQGRGPGEWTAGATALIAYRDLLAGDPAAARTRAETVLAAGTPLGRQDELALRVVHAIALGDEGECAAGLAASRAARTAFGDADAPDPLLAALAVLEHRAALACGAAEVGAEIAEWLERRTGKIAEVLLMDAWAHLVADRPDAARAAVEPVAAGAVTALVAHTPVEMHLVRAEVALRAGDGATGRAELDAALTLGSALDVVRPFALATGPTGTLIRSAPPSGLASPFARRLAAGLAAVRPDVSAPLSERELAVLALLPSLLSAGEIADELTVSVNTVKSHIRAIYRKLGVSTRRDAVRRAHERRLFT